MARTNRRREPNEIVNTKRSIKKSSRRGDRKSLKRKLQEIDYQDPNSWDNIDNEDFYVKGYNFVYIYKCNIRITNFKENVIKKLATVFIKILRVATDFKKFCKILIE